MIALHSTWETVLYVAGAGPYSDVPFPGLVRLGKAGRFWIWDREARVRLASRCPRCGHIEW